MKQIKKNIVPVMLDLISQYESAETRSKEFITMVEEKMTNKESCASEEYDEHLCFLICDGFYETDSEAFRAMVQDAQYRCQICGRTAKSAKNLCDPVAL
ncbi:hypothetical protein ACFL5F_07055 [Planctomycetota bacterium]